MIARGLGAAGAIPEIPHLYRESTIFGCPNSLTNDDFPGAQVRASATVGPSLSNAPIREAVIDFRVRLGRDTGLDAIRRLADSAVQEYPRRDPIHQFHGQIRFDDGGIVAERQGSGLHGYRITSRDGLNVAQVRLDGFTFSRLMPYRSWGDMVRDAWPIWRRYVAELRPVGVARVATRFINVLQLPPETDLGHFLTAPPQIPAGLPATCSAFLFRYVTEATDGMAATVSLATEPPEDSGSVSVVLDIDCYEHREFTVTGGEMAGIRNALSELRVRKNDIFFRSVTPQALEMWK